MKRSIAAFIPGLLLAISVFAADVSVPRQTIAGSTLSLKTSGTGDATIVVIGPGHIVSKRIALGKPLELTADDIADAGRYILILLSSDAEIDKSFVVMPAKPAHVSFVAHPSRAPVAIKNGISGTAYAFDAYDNLVSESLPVDFKLSGNRMPTLEREVVSKNGVAAVSIDSPQREGPVTFQAATGGVIATRIVRVVADEPCTLRIHAEPVGKGIRAQTEPVKDCSGNLVPDGTLVTFTAWDSQGRSTVDASVKKGIAQVNLPAKGEVTVSAASGVALGNTVRLQANP
jgi:hypothetical protein